MASSTLPSQRQWTTPLIIGTYLVTGISGAMLFFHFGESLIKEAHEWIGMLFLLGALLHIRGHWVPFKRYFTRPLAQTVIAAALVAGTAFMIASGNEAGGSPVRAVMQSIEQAPLPVLAQLQQREPQELVALLESAGLTITDPGAPLHELAKANGRSPREVIPLLFSR